MLDAATCSDAAVTHVNAPDQSLEATFVSQFHP
jgi:hypothetical protein